MTVSVPVVGSWVLRAGLRARRGVDDDGVMGVVVVVDSETSSTASTLTRRLRGVLAGETVDFTVRLRLRAEEGMSFSAGGMISSISGVVVFIGFASDAV